MWTQLVGKLLSGILSKSKMFSKICSVAVVLDYFVADNAFRCCLILGNNFFPDIASNLRHEGQIAEVNSKNCATKRKLSAFLSVHIKF